MTMAMAMASSLSYSHVFCNFTKSISYYSKQPKHTQIRSQSFRDEGKSANMVDSNMVLLRERIEKLKRKEVLQTKPSNGWNCNYGYDEKHKGHTMLSETMQILGLVGSSFGVVFLFGALCIFLVSFVAHLKI